MGMAIRRTFGSSFVLVAAAFVLSACALPEYSTYKVVPDAGAGGAPSACALLDLPDDGVPPVCSPSTAGEMGYADFVNNCVTEAVTVYWLDDTCTEQFFFNLAPGGMKGVEAYVGDVWRVREQKTQRLMMEAGPIPSPGNTVYEIP